MLRFPREEEAPKGVSSKLLTKIVRRFQKGKRREDENVTLSTFGDSVFSQPRGYISSGIVPVDCVVCFGLGFPCGIIEIFGDEATLKSAIMEETLAESQRRGYYTVLFPTEYSLDYRRAKIVGLDEKKLLISEVETIEDLYDQMRFIVRDIRKVDTETPIVIGWDSIAATPTRTELENKAGLDGSDMGKAALQMSKLFRRMVGFLFKNKVCLLCVNQTRMKLGVMFGSKVATFGGKAIRFYAWVRCRTSRIKTLKDSGGEKIGYLIRMECVKNKSAPPERSCTLPIFFDRGIDKSMSVWEYCVDKGVFKKKRASYRYNGFVMTRKTFPKYYRKHKEEIDAACRKTTIVKVDK